MDAQTASDLGLVTHLVGVADVDNTISEISANGKPANKYPGKPANSESKIVKFAESFYSDNNLSSILQGLCPDGFDSEDKLVSRQLKSLSRTAPIAVSLASNLINLAEDSDLEEGLKSELESLRTIFSTNDALEGLSALIEGRKATYSNS